MIGVLLILGKAPLYIVFPELFSLKINLFVSSTSLPSVICNFTFPCSGNCRVCVSNKSLNLLCAAELDPEFRSLE